MALRLQCGVKVITGPHIGIGHSSLLLSQIRGLFVGRDVKSGVGEEEESLYEGVHNGEERTGNVKGGHVAVEEVVRMWGKFDGDIRWKVGFVTRCRSDPSCSVP